ncbi:hypothetical protein ACJ73_00378 [Blastomyces percursus]|uniref:RING-type domain-containing protein n=1 Tax=Blastomyces percursus TaxID=1658174 RepID=A0A1J9RKS9_9EURO|nr:hypothetical protein ACJ73_00378 [Blastomyces percursus]
MASADNLRTVIIISDEKTDEQPLARRTRRSQRKRPRTDYSYPAYDESDDLATSDSLESEMEQPLKKQKISNLDMTLESANREIHTIFEAERAKRRKLEEEVQRLHAEMAKLETKLRELKHRFECEICYSIPSEWRTLLPYGHRFCTRCLRPAIGDDCPKCRSSITGILKSY